MAEAQSDRSAARMRVTPCGDSALLVRSEADDPKVRWTAAHGIAAALREVGVEGIEAIIATFDSVMVEFDPLVLDAMNLQSWILDCEQHSDVPYVSGRTVGIPVLYGGEWGPDLDNVAHSLDMSCEEVIELHSTTPWRVAFTGAPAGAPLHESQAFPRPVPRVTTPRVRIAPGSIAVAGLQGTIYTVEAPGGWRLLGRTPLRIINAKGSPFTAIKPGDYVKFRPISEAEFARTVPQFIGETL